MPHTLVSPSLLLLPVVQIMRSLLAVLTARHAAALLPVWQAAAAAAGERGRTLLAQLAAVVAPASGASAGGDARLRGYVGLLLSLISAAAQVRPCELG
jgi:hypothetical protein